MTIYPGGSQSSTTIEAFSGLLRHSADLEKSVDDPGNRNNGTEHFMTRKTRSSVADYLRYLKVPISTVLIRRGQGNYKVLSIDSTTYRATVDKVGSLKVPYPRLYLI